MNARKTTRAVRAKKVVQPELRPVVLRHVQYTVSRRGPERLVQDLLTNEPALAKRFNSLQKEEFFAFYSERHFILVSRTLTADGHAGLTSHQLDNTTGKYFTPALLKETATAQGLHIVNIELYEQHFARLIEAHNGSAKFGSY